MPKSKKPKKLTLAEKKRIALAKEAEERNKYSDELETVRTSRITDLDFTLATTRENVKETSRLSAKIQDEALSFNNNYNDDDDDDDEPEDSTFTLEPKDFNVNPQNISLVRPVSSASLFKKYKMLKTTSPSSASLKPSDTNVAKKSKVNNKIKTSDSKSSISSSSSTDKGRRSSIIKKSNSSTSNKSAGKKKAITKIKKVKSSDSNNSLKKSKSNTSLNKSNSNKSLKKNKSNSSLRKSDSADSIKKSTSGVSVSSNSSVDSNDNDNRSSNISNLPKKKTKKKRVTTSYNERVKYIVRVAPPARLEESSSESSESSSSESDEDDIIRYKTVVNGSLTISYNIGKDKITKKYRIDHSIKANTSQLRMYEIFMPNLINKLAEGENVNIFAFGQSGSGKQYSLFGTLKDDSFVDERHGILPRAAEGIFESLKNDRSVVGANIFVSFMELYNEEIIDLLVSPKSKEKKELLITENDKKGIVVKNLIRQYIRSPDDINATFLQGLQNGIISKIRKKSPAFIGSHLIFTIGVKTKLKNNKTRTSRLNLVCLGGSEYSKHLAKDTIKSLRHTFTSLSVALKELSSQEFKSIDHESCVLTHVLKNSLNPQSHNIFLANVSSDMDDLKYTLATLEYIVSCSQLSSQKELYSYDTGAGSYDVVDKDSIDNDMPTKKKQKNKKASTSEKKEEEKSESDGFFTKFKKMLS